MYVHSSNLDPDLSMIRNWEKEKMDLGTDPQHCTSSKEEKYIIKKLVSCKCSFS